MKKIREGFILPSAAYTLSKKQIQSREKLDKDPEVGDVIYGTVDYIGQHHSIENKEGRIHSIYDGSRSIFVFGSRYAPDAFEGLVPQRQSSYVDILARSAIVGEMRKKNTNSSDCSRVKVLGYVMDDKKVLNTRNYPLIEKVGGPNKKKKAKMILVVGGAMNSGKSQAAAICCWALSVMGHKVNATKVTGTASLKDILLMEDSGAREVADFSWLGHPSTYLLPEQDLFETFYSLDNDLGNGSGYWVVELADGILQRETAMLLAHEGVRSRIHKLVFAARDAVGVLGGLSVLENKFGLRPDAISGLCTSAPLAMQEVADYIEIPFFDSMKRDLDTMAPILL